MRVRFAARPRSTRWIAAFLTAVLGVASLRASAQTTTEDDAAGQIRAAIDAGQYDQAEAAARRWLDGRTDTRAMAPVWDLWIEARIRNGRATQSDTGIRAKEQVDRLRTTSPVDSPGLARSLRNLGDAFLAAGERPDAAACYREALSLDEPTGSPPAIAADLLRMAQVSSEGGDHDAALRHLDRALTTSSAGPDSNVLLTADVLRTRAAAWRRKGDYPRAHADLERALALLEGFGPNHPETATTLTMLGEQVGLEGDLLKGREILARAVRLSERAFRPGHPAIGEALSQLAATTSDLGDLTTASELGAQSLDILEQALGSDHPRVAVQRSDLAGFAMQQGNYALSRRLFEHALSALRKHPDRERPGIATVTFNLGLLHARLGDLREARRQFRIVTTMWTRDKGPTHPDLARPLSALAEALSDRGRHAEAQPYFERALAIRERGLGANHPLVGVTLTSLASSLTELGWLTRAERLTDRAIAIWERAGGQDGLAATLLIRGDIRSRRGDLRAAHAAYEQALGIRQPLLGATHPGVAESELRLARVEARQGARDSALARALQGQAANRDHLRVVLGSLAEREALDYSASRPRGLDLALSIALARSTTGGRTSVPAAPLFDALIRGRAIVLDEVMARSRAAAAAETSDQRRLWHDLTTARDRLASTIIRGPGSTTPAVHAAAVEAARVEKERAERALSGISAEFRSQLIRADVGLEAVRASLPPGTALVSYVRYERTLFDVEEGRRGGKAAFQSPPRPAYAAFVLRTDREPALFPLGPASSVDALVAQWRLRVVDEGVGSGEQPKGSAASTGRALRARIWDPIASETAGATRVLVVPDGALALLPIAALPEESGTFLIEHGPTIHYLAAERDLGLDRGTRARGLGLLAMGAPAFEVGLRAPQSGGDVWRGSEACPELTSMRFDALPGSGDEARAVSGIWNRLRASEPGTLLTGSAATEQAFKERAPVQRILHLATHGFFLDDSCRPLVGTRSVGRLVPAKRAAAPPDTRYLSDSPLLRSGLALAGANRRAATTRDDGIVTAEEVIGLDLSRVEWAVLSACDTGLGELRAGEGLLGLRRAFQVAGARSIIMSLWAVGDTAARSWMEGLYRARLERGLDTAESVRAAALAVIAERRSRRLPAHPFFWAGFVGTGSWE